MQLNFDSNSFTAECNFIKKIQIRLKQTLNDVEHLKYTDFDEQQMMFGLLDLLKYELDRLESVVHENFDVGYGNRWAQASINHQTALVDSYYQLYEKAVKCIKKGEKIDFWPV